MKKTYEDKLFWEGYDVFFKLCSGYLNWKLCKAVAYRESKYKADAVGSSGEIGVMQLMPATAQDMGCYDISELYQPDLNIKYGCKYLNWLWEQFGGKMREVIVSYNYGIGNVKKAISEYGIYWFSKIPEVRQEYYNKVMYYYSRLGG